MPTNPNMRNEKLRSVFESLGFANVQTVISSGNVIFETNLKDIPAQEAIIEKALTKQLGITSGVFIRSQKDLKTLIKKDPFKGAEHNQKSYLIVTFLKKKPHVLFNTVDLSKAKTADFMRQIEKEFGKENTTRTWKTIQRMLKKMEA